MTKSLFAHFVYITGSLNTFAHFTITHSLKVTEGNEGRSDIFVYLIIFYSFNLVINFYSFDYVINFYSFKLGFGLDLVMFLS